MKFKKGDLVKTWRGNGKVIDIKSVGGIPFVAIKYGNMVVGTNDLKSIKKRR